jgi:hypothetical protein
MDSSLVRLQGPHSSRKHAPLRPSWSAKYSNSDRLKSPGVDRSPGQQTVLRFGADLKINCESIELRKQETT